mmetsp:Transcript_34011/g.49311  ORF Transcript_34011/g.49311 Transcript_34011/m.49311 type:complete len:394 (-) Transcript_34011:1145-2326(-)
MIFRSGAVNVVDSDSVRDSSNTCTVEVSSASSAAHMFASSVVASPPPPPSSSSVMEDISEAKISIRPWRQSDVDWPPQLLRVPDSPESSLVMVPSISNKIRSMRVGARASTIFLRFDFNLQQCFNSTSAGQAGLLKKASLDGFRRFPLLPPPPVLDLHFLHMISSRRILFKTSLTSSSIHRNNIPKHLPVPASATILVMANSFSSSIFSFSSPSTSSDTTSSVASPSTPASRYVTTIGGNEVTEASLLYPPFGSLASLLFPDAPPPPPELMFMLKFMPIPKLMPIFKPMLLAILLALPPAFPLPPPPLLSNTCLRHRTCWTTRTFNPMSIILPATSNSKSSALSPICKSFAICCLRSDMRGSLLSLLAMLLADEEDTSTAAVIAEDLLFCCGC